MAKTLIGIFEYVAGCCILLILILIYPFAVAALFVKEAVSRNRLAMRDVRAVSENGSNYEFR